MRLNGLLLRKRLFFIMLEKLKTRHWVCLLLLVFACVSAIETSQSQPEPNLTVMIPMRDGKELAADVYLPSPDSRHLPCILVRSPAGRKFPFALPTVALVKAGYAVVIQETRSFVDLEGKTMPFIDDGWGPLQDGYDTVEWLAKSEFTNGKIGTVGGSALGITQLMLAPTCPSALKAQYIRFATGSIYNALYPSGQLHKNQVEGWLGCYAKDPSHLIQIRKEPFYGDFWDKFDSDLRAKSVKTPAVFFAGWFDTFSQGTIEAFNARQNNGGVGAKGSQKLVIGPWTHYWPHDMKLGDFEVPEKAKEAPVAYDPVRWFDRYLKDTANGVEKLPSVYYYVMGPFDGSPSKGNVWKESSVWPIPHSKVPFFLTEDHRLTSSKPIFEKIFSYLYDPNNPIQTHGGRNLFLESGPKDQREIEKRHDVIVFTTPPLAEDLEVTGKVLAELYVTTDCDDTDISVRLTDVYPDGRSILILDSLTRLGSLYKDKEEISRKTRTSPHEVLIDLHNTSAVFAKGHKIRLSISSSNYPRFEKNHNHKFALDPQNPQVASNILYVGPKFPSKLILPVVK